MTHPLDRVFPIYMIIQMATKGQDHSDLAILLSFVRPSPLFFIFIFFYGLPGCAPGQPSPFVPHISPFFSQQA
ncbi:hypothetical protein PILCRDRAFT_419974 [Piloderma croceum F 1598]|uniref:Uncharacterized protein n=1 Tax=Piloderma croceum (strain F 1598) TaxID=765440 RepID=A0A0C3BCC1_PILCF|nr:hypothetical protein PILCRDRAFT_419974 [Piloderma croceum F 1598]